VVMVPAAPPTGPLMDWTLPQVMVMVVALAKLADATKRVKIERERKIESSGQKV